MCVWDFLRVNVRQNVCVCVEYHYACVCDRLRASTWRDVVYCLSGRIDCMTAANADGEGGSGRWGYVSEWVRGDSARVI